jgi:hypothetical protein
MSEETIEEPKFDHDCNRCIFLGSYEGNDLYYCCINPRLETIIARHSNKPDDYTSGLFLYRVDPLITEGVMRAKSKGYLQLL